MKKTIHKAPEIIKVFFPDGHEYETQKGRIMLLPPSIFTTQTYVISCHQDHPLFDGIEEYSSFEAAEKRIEQLLCDPAKGSANQGS